MTKATYSVFGDLKFDEDNMSTHIVDDMSKIPQEHKLGVLEAIFGLYVYTCHKMGISREDVKEGFDRRFDSRWDIYDEFIKSGKM